MSSFRIGSVSSLSQCGCIRFSSELEDWGHEGFTEQARRRYETEPDEAVGGITAVRSKALHSAGGQRLYYYTLPLG